MKYEKKVSVLEMSTLISDIAHVWISIKSSEIVICFIILQSSSTLNQFVFIHTLPTYNIITSGL